MRPALALGLVIIVVALVIVLRRVRELYRMFRSGQRVAPRRPADPRRAVESEATEVLGQRKLLKGIYLQMRFRLSPQ